MRAVVFALASLLSTASLARPAEPEPEPEPDRVQIDLASHWGMMGGGAFGWGPSIGARAALALRVDPDFALQASAVGSADLLFNGYASSSYTVGGVWSPGRVMRIGAHMRSRSFTDGAGVLEAVAEGVARALVSPLCGGAEASDCGAVDSVHTHIRDVGLELTLASQWQWSWFVLSLEWVSFYQPVVLWDAWRTTYDSDGEKLFSATATDISAGDLPRELRLFTLMLGAAF